jgi:hypothetical protein
METDESTKRVVHQIDRLDNFQGLSARCLRFRSSIEGPTFGAGEFREADYGLGTE